MKLLIILAIAFLVIAVVGMVFCAAILSGRISEQEESMESEGVPHA